MPDYFDWPVHFPPVTHFIDERDNPKPWRILSSHPDYEAAKNHEDLDAAQRLIRCFMDTPWAGECVQNIAREYPDAVITAIHALEKNGKNKIPVTLAHNIAEMTGLKEDDSIVQTNLVKRTGNDAIYRFAFRPRFDGQVQAGRNYILIDDVFSNGGSFSELRQYIQQQGGNVVHTAVMTTGGHGNIIALTPQTRLDLERKFGVTSLIDFCTEVGLYGGNYKALTEPEAFFLARSPSLDAARDRIAQARQESFNRISAQDIQKPQTPDGTVAPEPRDNTSLHSPETLFDGNAVRGAQLSFDFSFSASRPAHNQDDFIQKTVVKNADPQSIHTIIGKKIPLAESGGLSEQGWKHLYNALARYRNKQFETFRYLFLDKNGKIADHLAITCRHPSRVSTSPMEFSNPYFLQFMASYAAKNKYTIVVCHNHPSGNPDPSDEDEGVTETLRSALGDKFSGHIILDHGTFTFCDPDNNWSRGNTSLHNKDPLLENRPERLFNMKIKSGNDLALAKAALQVDGGRKWNDTDWIPVVFVNAASDINALHFYHKSDFTRKDASLFLIEKTVRIAQATGSTKAFPVTDDRKMFNILYTLNRETSLFTDFYVHGKTLDYCDKRGTITQYINDKITYVDSTVPLPSKPMHEPGNFLNAAEMTLASPSHPHDGCSVPRNDLLKWGAVNTPALHKAIVTVDTDIKNLPEYKKKKAAPLKRKKSELFQKLHHIYARLELDSFDKSSFESSVDAVFENTPVQSNRHNLVYFGHVPQILTHAGLPHSHLYMDSTHLYTSMKEEPSITDENIGSFNYHGIHPDIIKRIPDSLKNPLLIFQSVRYPASLVAVLDLYDKNNNPVIVPITPFRKYSINSVELRYNKISSVYGKSHVDRFIDNHKNMILYVNENRSRLFLPRERQSLRAALDHLGSGFYENNIQHYKNTVKTYAAKTGVMDPAFLAEPQAPYGYHKNTTYRHFHKNTPEAPVPPFVIIAGNTAVSYENCRFLRTEHDGQAIILQKNGRPAAVSAILYNQIISNASSLKEKKLSPETIEKYARAVNADSVKTRRNTAANYWYNYRILCRTHASNPDEAMKVAKAIIRKMPRTEQEKLKSHITSYAKTSWPPESYNQRILRFFKENVKSLHVNRSKPHARDEFVSRIEKDKKRPRKTVKKNQMYEIGY
jgi:adenine/guanine phosphoribosyltransferase-like PRPP-binding protein